MNISNLIKFKRAKKEMSMQKLADDLGISISYLSRIESGERRLGQDLIKKISKVLTIPEKDLQLAIIKSDIVSKYGSKKFFKEAIFEIQNDFQKNQN